MVFYHHGRRPCLHPLTSSPGQGLYPTGAQGSTTSTKVTELTENNGQCLLLCAEAIVETELCDLILGLGSIMETLLGVLTKQKSC